MDHTQYLSHNLTALKQILLASTSEADGENLIREILKSLRTEIGMDVAFIAEFSEGKRVFRYIDGSEGSPPVKPGDGDPIEHTYCQRVIDGQLPDIIFDIGSLPPEEQLAVAEDYKIKSYLCVPITFEDGRIYGSLGCIGHQPNWQIGQEDIRLMSAMADVYGQWFNMREKVHSRQHDMEAKVQAALNGQLLEVLYQPIFDIKRMKAIGFESLARVRDKDGLSPLSLFKEAEVLGHKVELELKAIRLGLQGLDYYQEGQFVSVNASKETALSPLLPAVLDHADMKRVVLEINDPMDLQLFSKVTKSLRALLNRGLRIALDDRALGTEGLKALDTLGPDIIKLKVRNVMRMQGDRLLKLQASPFSGYSEESACKLIVEGVETRQQLDTILELGITHAQGYFLGAPIGLLEAAENY
jgi:EAL domain-containing protein (putative c-di-GMP-specific phosphodiesterase class I)